MSRAATPPISLELPSFASRSKSTHSIWLRSPAWDAFWMQSALWLAPIAWWLARGYEDAEASPLDTLYFAITALFWIGHRLGSTYLAYCTEAYRPLLRSQPIRFIVLPAIVTITCFAVFLPQDNALPWTRAERLVVLAIVDYAWVTWHFAAQHFGALSLYRSRAGRARCTRTRRLDRCFALFVGGVLVFAADILAGAVAYQERWIDRWILPNLLSSNQEAIRYGATAILLLATAVMLLSELRAGMCLPRILYIVGLALMVAIALQPRSLFLFLAIWTSQHWILATGLASRLPQAEAPPPRGIVRRAMHRLNVRPWAVLLLLGAVSIILLPFFEVEANRQFGTYYGDRIFGSFATALRDSSWVPALVALGFATGFMHYLQDRNIYRMSDPQVREAARGLLTASNQSVKLTARNVARHALVQLGRAGRT